MTDLIVLDIETNIHTGYPVVITVGPPSQHVQLIRPNDPVMLQWLADMMGGDNVLFVGHNIAFDFATLQTHLPVLRDAIWSLYRRGRVSDTMVREKLIRCAAGTLSDNDDGYQYDPLGGYSLAALATKYFNATEMDKGSGSWRTRFHELESIPTSEWPQPALDYCIADVDIPRRIHACQLEQDSRLVLYPSAALTNSDNPHPTADLSLVTGLLLNEKEQVRAAIALQLMSQGGISTDAQRVWQLEDEWSKEVEAGRKAAARYFLPAKHSATRTMFDPADVYTADPTKCVARVREDVAAEYKAMNLPVPLTKGGDVKIDEDTLSLCKRPELVALGDMTGTNKLLTSFFPVLEGGITTPLHPSYDILKATGRTSAFGPNIQQLPRKGGVRECFIPREGYTFIEADYSQLELCALAQVHLLLFGKSAMADAIRQGKDLHINTASVLLGKPYDAIAPIAKSDKTVKDGRQLCKAANFGFAGGMGAEKFVTYARVGYGLTVPLPLSADLKKAYLRTYPEQILLFDWVKRQLYRSDKVGWDGKPRFDLTQLVSGRIRGMCGFCDGANTTFQGLAADGAKLALYLTAMEAYNDPTSPLYGCVGGCFIHDEIILEAPISKAPQAAKRLGQLMVYAMEQYIPDVPIKAEPLIMDRLYKDAEPAYDDQGNLVPWQPKATK